MTTLSDFLDNFVPALCPHCGAAGDLATYHVYPAAPYPSLEVDYDCPKCGGQFWTEGSIKPVYMLNPKTRHYIHLWPSDDMAERYVEWLADGYQVAAWAEIKAIEKAKDDAIKAAQEINAA